MTACPFDTLTFHQVAANLAGQHRLGSNLRAIRLAGRQPSGRTKLTLVRENGDQFARATAGIWLADRMTQCLIRPSRFSGRARYSCIVVLDDPSGDQLPSGQNYRGHGVNPTVNCSSKKQPRQTWKSLVVSRPLRGNGCTESLLSRRDTPLTQSISSRNSLATTRQAQRDRHEKHSPSTVAQPSASTFTSQGAPTFRQVDDDGL